MSTIPDWAQTLLDLYGLRAEKLDVSDTKYYYTVIRISDGARCAGGWSFDPLETGISIEEYCERVRKVCQKSYEDWWSIPSKFIS
jgi:hypothetical protein